MRLGKVIYPGCTVSIHTHTGVDVSEIPKEEVLCYVHGELVSDRQIPSYIVEDRSTGHVSVVNKTIVEFE